MRVSLNKSHIVEYSIDKYFIEILKLRLNYLGPILYTPSGRKNEPIFFCVRLFQYLTETGDFFRYIRPKESRSISYKRKSVPFFGLTVYTFRKLEFANWASV